MSKLEIIHTSMKPHISGKYEMTKRMVHASV